MRLNMAFGLAAIAAATWIGSATAQPRPELIRGRVQAITADQLTLITENGTTLIKIAPGATVSLIKPSTLADIKSGSFIGTTNVPTGDGMGQSTEVHIFPPGERSGEGDRPMTPDPSSATPRMTNGAVTKVEPQTATRMTNGAVASTVSSANGLSIEVDYGGGKRRIAVLPGTPITMMAPGKMSDVGLGDNASALVTRSPEGLPITSRINVETGGN